MLFSVQRYLKVTTLPKLKRRDFFYRMKMHNIITTFDVPVAQAQIYAR